MWSISFGGGAARLHRMRRDREAFDIVLLSMVVGRDTLGRNYGGSGWSQETDRRAAEDGLILLSGHSLSAQDLAELAARLDRLDEVRPTVAREYRLGDAMERLEALEGSLKGWEHSEPLEAGVRHLFLPSVALAAALGDIEDAYRSLQDVEKGPAAGRFEAAEGLGPPWRRGQAPGTCLVPTNNRYYEESLTLGRLSLLRTAVAVAWHEADTGTRAGCFEDLVPKYLSRVPQPCSSEETWGCSAGILTIKTPRGEQQVPVKRR